MRESSDDIAVLQQHLGPQWPGSEAEGRAAMVQILQTVAALRRIRGLACDCYAT